MLKLYAMLGYAALAAVIVFLIWRLTRTKEALVAARRTAVRAQARQEAARQAAQAASQRCRKALGQAEQSLAQTGQALEIAGHIELVSQQVSGLIAYITSPFEEPLSAGPSGEPAAVPYRPGRHALPAGAGYQDLNDDDAEMQMEFIP
jgi:Flp pilus assembly protein TadB